MDRLDPLAARPSSSEERLALVDRLSAEYEHEAACLDATFHPCDIPADLLDMGLIPAERPPEVASLRDQMPRRDHDSLMATIARTRRLGCGDCTIRALDTGETIRLVLVDLTDTHGVYLLLTGAALPPVPGSDRTESIRPRRIVHHRNELAEPIWIDPRTEDLLGIAPSEMLGRSTLEFIHPDDHDRGIDGWLAMLGGQPAEPTRIRWRTADGDWCWLEVSYTDKLDTDGHIEVELLDVDDEMRALARAREGEVRFRALTESLPLGVIVVDGTGEVAYANQWLRDFTAIDSERPGGAALLDLVGDGVEETRAAFQAALSQGEGSDLDITFRGRRHSDTRTCRVRVRPVHADGDVDPADRQAIASIEDITDSLELERQLRRRAATDDLTGLWNRASLVERLQSHIDRADAPTDVAVLFIDLDEFKLINDGLGHDAGDDFLVAVSRRLRAALRDSDIVARVGGDEFAVLMEHCPDLRHATVLAERLIEDCQDPVDLNGTTARVSCSVGIALLEALGNRSAEELMSAADLAMYSAKRAGGGRWAIFDEKLRDQMLSMFELQREIAESIDNEAFTLFLQPFRDLRSGVTVGAECLVRWNHPHNGLTGTDDFMPIAERSGLIVPLGRWVADQACRLAARAAASGRSDLRISLNVSGRQLSQGGFADDFLAAADRHGVDPAQTILEVTETVFIGPDGDAVDMLRTLREAGCSIALDDFGTGCSSLNQLRLAPASIIKIDGSFVGDLTTDPGTRAITEAIGQLSRTLGFEMIAEAVETPEQLHLLREMHVPLGQGHLLGRPLREEEFFTALHQQRFPDLGTLATS